MLVRRYCCWGWWAVLFTPILEEENLKSRNNVRGQKQQKNKTQNQTCVCRFYGQYCAGNLCAGRSWLFYHQCSRGIGQVDGEYDYVTTMGCYSSLEKAKEAEQNYRLDPDLVDHPEGFCIDKYEIDKMEWNEGFFTWKE